MTADGSTQAWNLERGNVFTLKPDGTEFRVVSAQNLTVGGEGRNAGRPKMVNVAADLVATGERRYRMLDWNCPVWIVG